jgi:5,10-methylenetetrahydrofolate reductase
VDAVNVPDLQNAIMRLGSLSVCALLKSKGMEVIYNLSCSDRNRLALQSELLNAAALGLKNVLVLQGDHPSIGDHFEAQPVFDLDVMGLLGAVKRLQEGYDLMGNDLQGKPQFCVGTVVNAAAKGHVLDLETMDMEKKIRLGVDFFFTSSVYDVSLLETFIKKVAHFKVPIVVGITLLKSVGMARYVNKHVEGASIPDSIIDKLMRASDKREASIEIATDLIKALRPLCQGIQIIPIGWENLVPALLDHAGL